jgi:hypothetical protein
MIPQVSSAKGATAASAIDKGLAAINALQQIAVGVEGDSAFTAVEVLASVVPREGMDDRNAIN